MARGRIVDAAADILVRNRLLDSSWLARHPYGAHVYRDAVGRERDCNCRPFIDAYLKFLAEHAVSLYYPEQGMFRNRGIAHIRFKHDVLQYTTEPDQVLCLDDYPQPCVVDIKTGGVPAHGDLHPWGLQTAAQKEALTHNGISVGLRMILNLRDDGTYRLFREWQDKSIFTMRDAGAFKALLQAWHIRRAMGGSSAWIGRNAS
jgi:hypothetical protein